MKIGLAASSPNIAKAIEDTQRAKDGGFHSIWFNTLFATDAMTACAAAGQAVDGIELGTAVVPTYPRHPFAMAQQALSTHDACGGRFTLGIGLSHRVVIENMLGLDFDPPVRHAREYVGIIRSLFDTGSVDHQGEIYRVQAMIERPRDDVPSLLLAALGEQMLRVAGDLTDGTILWMTGPRTVGDHIVPTITKATEAAGRPAPRVVVSLPVCVTDDADAAREKAAGIFSTYGQLPTYKAMLDREGAEGPADVAMVGDETEVEKGIQRVFDAGATEFTAAPFDELKRSFELLRSLF